MSTRKEITGHRSLDFSRWIRKNLPDSSTGFMVSDIDFYIYNSNSKHLVIIEEKTYGAKVSPWQKEMYDNLSRWIKKGIDNGWTFHGCHVITFEKTCFDNGRAWLDGKLISESDFIQKFEQFK